jgi:hypothetical protein
MAKSFFKTNFKKHIKPAFIKSAVRGGSTVATAWLANETIPKVLKIGESNPANLERYRKFSGAALFLLGTLGEAALANEDMIPVAQGVSSYGALHMTGNWLLPNRKTELGLGSIGETNSDSEITDWEVLRQNMGAIDPLEDVNRTLDSALARAITGPDDNEYQQQFNFSSTAAAAGGGVAPPAGGASVNGMGSELTFEDFENVS